MDRKSLAVPTKRDQRKTERKVDIKEVEMPEDMVRDAIELAKFALDNYKEKEVWMFCCFLAAKHISPGSSQQVCEHIKKEFDKKYTPTWHCIYGASFGSLVTHEARCFLFFYLDEDAFLLFKQG
jgi:dynein light chain LC8-type